MRAALEAVCSDRGILTDWAALLFLACRDLGRQERSVLTLIDPRAQRQDVGFELSPRIER
jgi:hypothetical protein